MKKSAFLCVFGMSILILSSCGTTRITKLERTNDYEELFQAAVAYYEQGRYDKAKMYLEKITPYYRGSLESEKIKYYWAKSEYYLGYYQLAAYQFKEFYRTFGRSPFAERSHVLRGLFLVFGFSRCRARSVKF